MSVIVLVLVLLFVGFVAYSAVQVVKSAPRVGPVSMAMEANGTVGIDTSFTISNPSYFTIQKFTWPIDAIFQNNSGVYVVHVTLPGPTETLTITLTYNTDVLNPAIAQGSISAPITQVNLPPGSPIPGTNLNFNTTAPLTGTVISATDGRGIVESGTLVGDIEVLDSTDTIVQSCVSSTHVWTMTEN